MIEMWIFIHKVHIFSPNGENIFDKLFWKLLKIKSIFKYKNKKNGIAGTI